MFEKPENPLKTLVPALAEPGNPIWDQSKIRFFEPG